MSDSIFKGVEIVGTSEQSFNHAIEAAVARARQTLHNLSWFVVKEMRGGLHRGRTAPFQHHVAGRFALTWSEILHAARVDAEVLLKVAAKVCRGDAVSAVPLWLRLRAK